MGRKGDFQSLKTSSSLVGASKCVVSSVAERSLDRRDVGGSNPSRRTSARLVEQPDTPVLETGVRNGRVGGNPTSGTKCVVG